MKPDHSLPDTGPVLVTGATGLIGSAVLQAVHSCTGSAARGAVRNGAEATVGSAGPMWTPVGDIGPACNWSQALAGMRHVIHTSARAHIMRDAATDPLAEFRRVNFDGTLNLARQSAAAGVRRFVFLSSIKVNGEQTDPGRAFAADDPTNPQDPYAISKHEAEVGLRAIAADTGMEVVIIRPPLVYGPGVKANFVALLRAVARGVPLPLGSIHNLRSLIALPNLVDFILTCLTHPAAANQTFVVCDGEDLSTPDLVRRMARAMDRPARLLPVPPSMLIAGAALVGKRAAAERLCGNLQIDNRKARDLLGWTPPIDVDEGVCRTVQGTTSRIRR